MASTSNAPFDMDGLRKRNKPQQIDPRQAPDLVGKLNEEEKAKGKDRKTFGRTENGTGKCLTRSDGPQLFAGPAASNFVSLCST